MKEKTKSYVDQNGKILKHFCYFFFSTLKETFPVHRYLYKHCNKSANTSGSWCNRNPTKNTHVLTSSKRSLSSHRERPCRSFLMLTQSRVSVAPILGRRRLKEGGGVTDTHATTTNYPCTTTESLLEHELDNQQLNQWAFRMSQKFNTVSTAFALSRGLHPKGSHNFELVRKILLIKEKDLNNVVLKLQKKKKRRRTLR